MARPVAGSAAGRVRDGSGERRGRCRSLAGTGRAPYAIGAPPAGTGRGYRARRRPDAGQCLAAAPRSSPQKAPKIMNGPSGMVVPRPRPASISPAP